MCIYIYPWEVGDIQRRGRRRGEVMMSFTEKQDLLVKQAWEMMKPHTDELGIRLFTLILQMAPEAKGLFSYLGENEIPENNKDFRGHAAMVFKMMCETAVRLREKGGAAVANRTLDAIASIHHQRGVLKYHFPLMGAAMLRIVKETVGDELWSEDMEHAWRIAFDELSYAILARMRAHESVKSSATLSL